MDNYFIIVLLLVIGTLSAQGDSYRTDFIPSMPLTGAVRQLPATQVNQQQQGCVWSTLDNNKNGSVTTTTTQQQRSPLALDCHVRTLNADFWSNYTFSRDQLEFTSRLNIKCNDRLFFESDLDLGHRYFNLRNVKEVSFQSCKLKKIPSRIFSSWGFLRSLTISSLNGEWKGNQMEIESGAFEGLSLLSIDLSSNNIWAIHDRNVFCPLRTSLLKLNISRNRLGDLDELGFGSCAMTRVQILDISHNSLRRLHPITKLPNVSTLLLQNNMIYEIDENTFQGLPLLRHINMSSNRLVAIPPALFKSNPELREVIISNNNLGVLSPIVFSNLSQLVHLDISKNSISFINPLTFQSLVNLKSLLLHSNKLTLIDSRLFSNLGNLKTLTLDSNEISEIDQDSLKNCPLEDIGLANNRLTNLPYLPKSLITADFGENLLKNVTNLSGGPMNQLYGLRLVGNRITELPEDFCRQMQALRVLNLAQNRIKTIPNTIICPQIRALRLDSNQIEDFPTNLSTNFASLLWLNVSSNRLQYSFYKLLPSTLEWLDLSWNEISVFASSVDSENDTITSSLRVVDLSFNKIEQLDFIIPPSLETLRLNNNILRNVAPYTFARSANLRRVDLRWNKLESLPLTAVRVPPGPVGKPLPEFYIAGNNFSCDSSMDWVSRVNQISVLRQYGKVMDIESVKCHPIFPSTNQLIPILEAPKNLFVSKYTEHCNADCPCCGYLCDCFSKCPEGCNCYHDSSWSINIVECSNSNHTDIPQNIPIDVTNLYLDGNVLPVLNKHIFLGRKNLRVLHLNGSHVQTIKNKTFGTLKSLEYLELSSNDIEEIIGFEFSDLDNLKELYLNNNKIRYISSESFTQNPLLRVLTLSGNLLTNFPVWEISQNNGYLNSIMIADNNWTCDCDFVIPFTTWIASKTSIVRDLSQIKCYTEDATVGSNGTESQFIFNMCKEVNFNFNHPHINDNFPALLDSDLLNSNHISAEKVASPNNDGNNINNNNHIPSINDITSTEENLLKDKSELWTICTSVLITLIIVLLVIGFFVFRKNTYLVPFWLYSWLPLSYCAGGRDGDDVEQGASAIPSLFNCCCGGTGTGGELGKKSRSKREIDDTDKLFDAYFIYSQKDTEIMDKLVTQLEGGNAANLCYRLCLHHRDLCFPPDKPWSNADLIDTACNASKRIVLLVSNNFNWETNHLRSCLHTIMQQQGNKFILIKVPPVQSDLHFQLEWGDSNFFSKLKLMLPTPTLSVNSTGTISSTDSSGNFNLTPNYHHHHLQHHNNLMNYSNNGVNLHEYAYNTINNHRNILPCNGTTPPVPKHHIALTTQAWQQQQHSQIIPIPGYPVAAISATTPLMMQNTFHHQPNFAHNNTFHQQSNIPQNAFSQPFNESFRRHLQQNKANINTALPAHHHHHHLSNCSNNSSQGHHHHHHHQGSHCSSSHSSSTNNNPSLHPYQPLDANYSSSSSNEELLDHVYSTLDSPPIIMPGAASCNSNNNGCESSSELDSKQINSICENSSSPLQNRLNNNNKTNCPVVNNNASGTQPNSPPSSNNNETNNNPANNGTMYFV